MKLIAIDLDGTLLSTSLTISERNKAAIQKAQEQGHIVMICSGRAPEDIIGILKEAKLDCHVAGSNGTAVYAAGKLLKVISIEKEDINTIGSLLDEEEVPYRIYSNQGIFTPDSWVDSISKVLESGRANVVDLTEEQRKKITEQPKKENIQLFTHIRDVADREDITVQKFFILTLDLDQKEKLSEIFKNIDGINVTSSGTFNLEVMNKEGHKGNGLKTAAAHFGVSMKDTVAIGDNFNDLPMLKAAGISIAMDNGDPHIKEICDYITASNDEDGVGQAIEKHVLT
ncbi:Cof-type HAD-IIB family hydrolase [Bacillus lacus]|uniref:Cof-type HAD-IIB family hydrolase n=1 Tax=Metabacillus lacus TaxID=1983721 RepID=A0A7X2IVZ5_9BACI|nr:Cof-type HAD-IIB family hydrolase [Metabacillus lacus]MRX70787.1 Cof-type HAD-IIB family hydrolase [Metabacillus lacus]